MHSTQHAIHAMEDRLLAHLDSDDRQALRGLLERALGRAVSRRVDAIRSQPAVHRPQVGEQRGEQGAAEVRGARGSTGARLVADRGLDHLHVPIAPLLQTLVEVDQPLADLRRPAVVGVDGEQHVVEPGASGVGGRVTSRSRTAAGTAYPCPAR